VENPLVVIFFGGVFVDFVCRLLRKATLNTGISQYQTLGKTKADYHPTFHKDQQLTGELLI